MDECFHRIAVRAGDAMFLPSGRVHALGAGNVIFEIQQNSDTTFRVHDWNRVDANGRSRELHIPESLASIDFDDFEPELIRPVQADDRVSARTLVKGPLFEVAEQRLSIGSHIRTGIDRPAIIAIVSGALRVEGAGVGINLEGGGFCLVPASLSEFRLECSRPTELLWAAPG